MEALRVTKIQFAQQDRADPKCTNKVNVRVGETNGLNSQITVNRKNDWSRTVP